MLFSFNFILVLGKLKCYVIFLFSVKQKYISTLSSDFFDRIILLSWKIPIIMSLFVTCVQIVLAMIVIKWNFLICDILFNCIDFFNKNNHHLSTLYPLILTYITDYKGERRSKFCFCLFFVTQCVCVSYCNIDCADPLQIRADIMYYQYQICH